MIRVKFVRDKVNPANGKLFLRGQTIVLSDAILDECLTDGSAVIDSNNNIADEIEALAKTRKKKNEPIK